MKKLNGIHHITAITSSAEKIYQFFTDILGLRLVKKTVNQDDINTYHLFFADDLGQPGTDMTFFDFNGIQKGVKGSDEISRIGFRVANDQAILYWKKRFNYYKIDYKELELFNRKMLFFNDFDDQEYAIVSDEGIEGVNGGLPWKKGPVPNEYAIIGLGPVFIRVNDKLRMHDVLSKYLDFTLEDEHQYYSLYEVGPGGNGASIILDNQPGLEPAMPGYGSVHHMAFRIDDLKALQEWIGRLNQIGARHSGHVNRFYFNSLYTRLYPRILFEFATEGPGFIDDEESYDELGIRLALPPKLRKKRQMIEAYVKHIDTKPKDYEKEYF
jgi:glyoxalase family protein